MSLLQKVYSVLLVSSSASVTASLCSLLPGSVYYPVHKTNNVSAAKRAMTETSYDIVIINAPIPKENCTEFAIDIGKKPNTVVLLLTSRELHAEIYETMIDHGIFTLAKPFSKQTFEISLEWLSAVRERIRSTEEKTTSLEKKMEEIRLVNRAKWLLINEMKMDEPQAHKYIEKQAMDRCITKREVAEMLIKTYL